ncbi:CDP-diacylglycerol--serine O-phosphatidyltransferase [Brumimicrobium salinarum]|uniref:CDP-diacylglycerol--serine O-phosphatidyltransferase n=1 Tax=Brumimicrobium salinarum TaxID=2058658 RepID=A0A2I0R231_9FLAO|nr:CDP-alcohol phosphatidyltransferase family protein [Brumimicrobium salinarum]PKR80641.1 CDP-diacylglycerol--serine O-phosphatidyltransferase [Brumimicrobium salinarum]
MFTVANILTGFNLLFGVSSIVFTFSGRIEWAVMAIIAGALCDFLDGFVARLMKQQGELGKQLDSLADMVTFGVAPGLIVFILLIISGAWDIIAINDGMLDDLWSEGTLGNNIHYWTSVYLNDLVGNNSAIYPTHFYGWYKVMPFFALIIPFLSLFRLAKFNLDERQATGFIGLPTPANSLFFASFALLIWDGFGQDNWKTVLSMTFLKDQILLTFVILFSLLLVAEIPLFALKFTTFKWQGNQLRYSFLAASLILIIALWVWAIPIIVILYIVLSVLNRVVQK